jgi:uncharacterized membrane protein YraQ (UPF0718 family)
MKPAGRRRGVDTSGQRSRRPGQSTHTGEARGAVSDLAQAPVLSPVIRRRLVLGVALFLIVYVGGLAYVKWVPYYHKALAAAAAHTIGTSILSGKSTTPPSPSWAAALGFARAYFAAIWQALLLALVLGATVQTIVPRRWLLKHFGRGGATPTLLATGVSATGMMCTCCTAAMVVGLRRAQTAVGPTIAFFIGNPVLNPAVILFIGFVLSWQFAVLRLGVGILLVLGVAWLAERRFGLHTVTGFDVEPAPIERENATLGELALEWWRFFGWEAATILPGYIAIVLLLGALRAYLFAPTIALAGHGPLAVLVLAIVGTLFVIPTGGEVPIVQTLLQGGMSPAAGAALLVTLPAVSLPSLYIVRSVFPRRLLAYAAAMVAMAGLVAAGVTRFAHLT